MERKTPRGFPTRHPARPEPGPLRRLVSGAARFVLKGFRWTAHAGMYLMGGGLARWSEHDYKTLKARAFANPFSWRAFTLIAYQFQSIPWLAYRYVTEDGEERLEELPDHEFARLLRRPSPGVSFARFVADVIDHLTFAGELFLYAPESEVTGPRAGKPGEKGLRLIRPDKVAEIERDDDDEVSYYRVRRKGGREERIPAGRIKHVYLFEHPERAGRGWPLAAAGARAVDLMRGGEDWQQGIYQNRGRLPGFFKFRSEGQTMDAEAFARSKAELQQAYSDAQDAGLPMLLEDVDWTPNGMTVRDADAVRVEQQAARRVAVGYGVMTPLLGDADNMTYDNLRVGLVALLNHNVLPILDWLLTELTAAYMGMYEPADAFLDYNADEIAGLEEDKTQAYDRAVRAAGRPILTVNEARGMNGWERIEDPLADTLFAPIAMVPVGADAFALPPETEADKALKALGSGDGVSPKDGAAGGVEDIVLKLTTPERP